MNTLRKLQQAREKRLQSMPDSAERKAEMDRLVKAAEAVVNTLQITPWTLTRTFIRVHIRQEQAGLLELQVRRCWCSVVPELLPPQMPLWPRRVDAVAAFAAARRTWRPVGAWRRVRLPAQACPTTKVGAAEIPLPAGAPCVCLV